MMPDEPTKTCPDCGGEYAPHGQVCAKCGKALVWVKEGKIPVPPPPEDEAGVCLREGRVGYIRELGEVLTTKRIGNSIRFHHAVPESGAAGSVYGIYVSPDDLDAAKEAERVHWLKGAPEHATTYRYEEQELAGSCPACGTALPEGAVECPECGLTVGVADVAECPACETEIPGDAEVCPNCGAEFE